MKVGILGSGVVGKTLAAGFVKHGHDVMVGSREKEKLESWKKETNEDIKLGGPNETAQFAELLVLSVKGTAAIEALEQINEESINGKTIIDTTNPIADSPPENGVLKFFTTLDKSLMEELQEKFPQSNFVKAFNSIGSALMVNPELETKPTMFICGNNEDSKKQVSEILDQFGFEVEDMGKVEAARAIEPLCMLWCIPGFLRNDWFHAFKLLKK